MVREGREEVEYPLSARGERHSRRRYGGWVDGCAGVAATNPAREFRCCLPQVGGESFGELELGSSLRSPERSVELYSVLCGRGILGRF
jgi:hypothetical protein